MLLVNLGKDNLVLLLILTSLYSTGEELLVNDDTRQRRIGLQLRVLHIAGLVTEDGTQQLLFR